MPWAFGKLLALWKRNSVFFGISASKGAQTYIWERSPVLLAACLSIYSLISPSFHACFQQIFINNHSVPGPALSMGDM